MFKEAKGRGHSESSSVKQYHNNSEAFAAPTNVLAIVVLASTYAHGTEAPQHLRETVLNYFDKISLGLLVSAPRKKVRHYFHVISDSLTVLHQVSFTFSILKTLSQEYITIAANIAIAIKGAAHFVFMEKD